MEKNLNIMIDKEMWKQIFQVCHKFLENNEYIWFQMQIIYRTLGKWSYLAKIHKIEVATWARYKSETETILHMFATCSIVKELWVTIEKYIKNRIGLTVSFSIFNITFGHTLIDHNQNPINTILLVTKKCIFDAAIKERNLNIKTVLSHLREVYIEQQTLNCINGTELAFNKIWNRWEPIFNGWSKINFVKERKLNKNNSEFNN